MNKYNLQEATTQLLMEVFRDYDEQIDELEDRKYDLENELGDSWQYDEEELQEMQAELDKINEQLEDLYNKRDTEYMEELKDLPKSTDKTDFEGFDITKTDPPADADLLPNSKYRDYFMKKYDYKDAYIAEVTPEQYLLLCGKYGWGRQYDNIDDIYNNLSKNSHELIHEYANRMKNGEKAPLPVLNIKKQGQEGRHRAFAAMEAGIETIPVLIIF